MTTTLQGRPRLRPPSSATRAAGVDPTQALVLRQVVPSFGIPFALVPLVRLTRRVDVVGSLVDRPRTTAAAGVVAALDAFLLIGTFA